MSLVINDNSWNQMAFTKTFVLHTVLKVSSYCLFVGREHNMQMEYRIAKNLPIDMYFVLDFTTTMQHRLKSLANLTANLSMFM